MFTMQLLCDQMGYLCIGLSLFSIKLITPFWNTCGRHNKELVKTLSIPAQGAKDLSFPTQYSQSFWTQVVACLWKTKLTYWRSPDYNCVRYFFTFMTAFIIGSMFWGVGKNT